VVYLQGPKTYVNLKENSSPYPTITGSCLYSCAEPFCFGSDDKDKYGEIWNAKTE